MLPFGFLQIDLHHPESVQLCYGDYTIGRMKYLPGSERIRSAHFKRAMITDHSWELLKVLAIDQSIGKPSFEDNPDNK